MTRKPNLAKLMLGIAVLALLVIGTWAMTRTPLTSAKKSAVAPTAVSNNPTLVSHYAAPLAPSAGTDPISGVFELDGDITDPNTALPDDWSTVNCGGGNAVTKTGVLHDGLGTTIFTGGGSKDPELLASWKHKSGSAPDKDEIINAYAAKYTGSPSGDDILVFGADRYDNSGTAFIGFWFFSSPVFAAADGQFRQGPLASDPLAAHQLGDVLIVVEFSNGGAFATAKVFEWVGTGGSESGGTLNDITATAPLGSVFSVSNGQPQTIAASCSAWQYTPKGGVPGGPISINSFFEGGINLDAFPALRDDCFSSFLVETRSSTSVTATLKDFVLGSFNTCVDLQVTKTASPTVACQGTPVDYTYTVTNTGGAPANFTVVDDNGTPGNTADDFDVTQLPNISNVIQSITLAPGETRTFTRSGVTNLPVGTTTNTVTATATDPASGNSETRTASATVTVHNCSISLTKTAQTSDICNGVSTPVNYTYVIRNTGDFFSASGTLVDDNGTPGNTADDVTIGSWGPLSPGSSQTLTRTFNLTGTRTNIATASGTSGGGAVSATATATVTGHNCSISLTKTPQTTDICNGVSTPVTYTYVVTNTGDFSTASGTIVDDNGTPGFTGDDVTVGSWGPLNPGSSATLTRTFNLTGTRTNIATASGTSGGRAVSATASATVTGHNCSISLTKTPQTGDICNGVATPVTYIYVVTNTGDFFSASGTLVDDNGTPGNTGDDVTVGSWGPLNPGSSATFTRTFNLTGTRTNIATASGTSGGRAVSVTATATVNGHNCSISLTKTPQTRDICNGVSTSVAYTYVVTNTGDFFTASGTIVDDNGTPGNTADDVTVGSWGPLTPGSSSNFAQTFNLTGTRTNTATASGTSGGRTVSATATATVNGHVCSIGLTKTPQTSDICNGVSTSVNYTYIIRNTGDFFSASGTLVDDNGTPGNTADDVTINSWGPLNPGSSATFTQAFNLTGTRTNVATASGTSGNTAVIATASATVNGHSCSISLTKTPQTRDICNGVSTPVNYTYVIRNTGDFFSASGTLVDDNGTPSNTADDVTVGSWGPLNPGSSATLTRTFNLTGTRTNIATASGTTDNIAVSATASATVNGHNCSISLTKTPQTGDICNGVSTPVNYTYVIRNTGDFFSASGTLVDDNGTPGNTADDVTVGSWGPLNPGSSQILMRAFNLTGTRTNTATASGTSGGIAVSTTASATVTGHICSISLTKTPNITQVQSGVSTPVTYTYVITNTGNFFPASGTLIDDNGTPGTTLDDVFICNWGPIAPGASSTCTHTFNLTGARTNVATASGTSGGQPVMATATATVGAFSCACNLGYPFTSSNPRTSVVFNESEVLRAFDPGPTTCATTGQTIKLWYNDEHALTLGVRRVNVKTASGTTPTNYPITPLCSTPVSGCGATSNVQVGTTALDGEQAGTDTNTCTNFPDLCDRPMFPSLFITDITNDPTSKSGDWQFGGTPIPPHAVFGTWKGAVRLIDKTHSPNVITVTPDPDPAKNNWNLGAGSDTPPGGFAALRNEGFGAECRWNVSDLGLLPGHTYRLQFMVHDGDQNKTGGDSGEGCSTALIPAQTAILRIEEDGRGSEVRGLPAEYAPQQNYLNPFNPTTMLRFDALESSTVRLSLYNLLGLEVATLVNGNAEAGYYSVMSNNENNVRRSLSSGIYFHRIQPTSLASEQRYSVRKRELLE